ncbi:MAG: SDR family NAD(P)-dependent oxidoreductase [Hyphomicrobiaceae bacterium]|nr:SDR family NAD(P)-dependent oxidoreductase [Hyphomicrobiaceae bacterium]
MTADQRSILITGCSTGIGLAAAQALRARGWRVLATARRPDDLDRLQREHGFEALALELKDEASIARCAEEALRRTDGKLYALYNNAAYGVIGAMEDIPASVLREQLEVNVVAAHELTRRIVPAMRREGRGRIVMCSSLLGFVSGPYRGAYAASKYALEAMSDALRVELRPAGIHVSLLEPGPIETHFLATTLTSFTSQVEIERSPHRETYERRLAAMRAGKPSPLKLGPQAVVGRLVHALEARHPRARYRIGLMTHGANVLKRLLPDAVLDRLVSRM